MYQLNTYRKTAILLLSTLILILGTSCRIFHPRQKPHQGELMTSIPHGRIELGEKDNMSGGRNEFSGDKKKKQQKKKKKKKSYKPAKKKKNKRR